MKQPLALTITGWSVNKGDTVSHRNGQTMRIEGREGNVMLVRRLAGPAALRPSALDNHIPIQRVHPSELGLQSNITLPHYAR